MKKSIIKLAKNKWVFYFFVALAIVNVLGYFSMKSWECMVLFAAVAYSVNCYAKNGTLAILGGLFVSNFVFGCNRVKEGFFEGMENGDKKEGEEKEKKKEENKADETQKQLEKAKQILSSMTNFGK